MVSVLHSKIFVVFSMVLIWYKAGTLSAGGLHYIKHPIISEEVKLKPFIPIVKQKYENSKNGYSFSYETGNGIIAHENAYFKTTSIGHDKHPILVQQGTIVYQDEHGKPVHLSYIADEFGFRPSGSHLPTSPPIPEAIAKSSIWASQSGTTGVIVAGGVGGEGGNGSGKWSSLDHPDAQ